jgi:hypothetical protein
MGLLLKRHMVKNTSEGDDLLSKGATDGSLMLLGWAG